MKLAIVAAEFTPDEANGLRRAMATFRHVGTINNFKEKFVGRMVARGYEPEFAERCFKQIEGFGSYGFPKATPRASPISSTSPPGSRNSIPMPSPAPC